MKKNYVLDTNVLLHDPYAINKFEDNDVIVPIYVLEEVDKFKRDSSERGRNAREVARVFDALRVNGASLSQGVSIGAGGSLRVYVPVGRLELSSALDPGSADHAIIKTAIDIRDQTTDRPTIFVTMDVNLRIRADALGIQTAAYENQAVEPESLETGIVEIVTTREVLEKFFESGATEIDDDRLKPNMCVMMKDAADEGHTALGRYHEDTGSVKKLITPREGVMGVRPRNREQSFAFDLLLDDSIRLVSLVGMAGTGKTLLALATGLQRVVQDGSFSRLLVSRPVIPLGRDLGYLPGDIQEKLNPWMKPIFDNLEFLLIGGGKRRGIPDFEEFLKSGQIEIEPLTYIRGRSLPGQYVIVDEAQNLTPHEVKTIVTRCAEGTKIVLTGDPFQIDNPYVDSATNGLSVAAARLKGQALTGHVQLRKGERSALANLAASKL